MQDKFAGLQFVDAVLDGFIRRTLQLEEITSFKKVVARAIAIKAIQENSFPKNDNVGYQRNENQFPKVGYSSSDTNL